jgi:hypothetical protein
VYSLRFDEAADRRFTDLPHDARVALLLALAEAIENPVDATEPYGVDDKYMRQVITPRAKALLVLAHGQQRIDVVHILPLP